MYVCMDGRTKSVCICIISKSYLPKNMFGAHITCSQACSFDELMESLSTAVL